MAMDIVKRTIEILAKGTVTAAKEPFTNVARLKEDASKIRDEVAKGYGSVKDTYQSMRSGGGLLKKVTEWFYQKGEQYGSDFEDDDFDAGFDSGVRPDDEPKAQILDTASMKDIAKSQVGAMYRIGGKQVEASMMNTAEIITSVNARTTEITAAVNNLNKSLVDISKKLDTISQVIAYKQQREEKEYAQTILDSSGRFSLANIFSKSGSNIKGSMPIQMAGMLLQIAQQGGPTDLASMLISSMLGDRKFSALNDKSFNEIAKNVNEGIGTATDKIIGKILDNKAFQKIFGDLRVDRSVGGNYATDRNEYNRDRAIFDGITRKTIVDIIPEYLREITKALNGRDLRPDRQGNLTSSHTDYFREEALKNFGFGYGDAYTEKTKQAIKDRVKALVGKEFTDQELRAAEADLVGAATIFFMMRGVVKIDPALIIQYKDEIYRIALRVISNSGGSQLKQADWYVLFDEVLGSVMVDKGSIFGSSSNAFCTKIQQNINTYHQRAKAAGQDHIAGKYARRLKEDDYVQMLAEYNQQYIGLGGEGLTAASKQEKEDDQKRLETLRKIPGQQAEYERLKRKIELNEYAHEKKGMKGDLAKADKSIVTQLSKNPVETMSHLEDIGMCILRKMHDVINVRVVHWKPKKFYPKWRNAQAPSEGSGGGSETSELSSVSFPESGKNETITDIIKGVTSGISDALSGEGSSGEKSKLAQYLDNRAELRGTSGKGERIIDAVGSGASAVGRAIKTRGASIRDGIGNFVDATIDDVKGMAGGYLDRRIEEQEKRKASISRAAGIRKTIGDNQTISDADKIAADTALSMMQAALQDGDGSKERPRILRQAEKIKNEDLKNSLKESISSMLDVQSSKESAPAKTKLGKILKWAVTGLGVVFAPIIKVVKGVGSILAKGFKFIGKFFTTLLKQGVNYAKKFGSATWDLTKLAGSKIAGAASSIKNAVFGSKSEQTGSQGQGAPGTKDADYSKDYGDASGQSKPGFFSSAVSKTKGAFSGAADKLKNSKFMQSEFMKGAREGIAWSKKEKTPAERIDDVLKSEQPKGVFKTLVEEIGKVVDVVKEQEEPTTTPGSTGQTSDKVANSIKDMTAKSTGKDAFSTKDILSTTVQTEGNILGANAMDITNVDASASGADGSMVQGLMSAATGSGGGTGLMGILGKMAGSLTGIFGVASIAGIGMKVLMKIGSEIMNIGIKPLKKALNKFWKALKPFIKTVGEAVATIVEPFAKVLGLVQDIVVPILNTIGKAVSKVVSWAMSFLGPLIETIGHGIMTVAGFLKIVGGHIVTVLGYLGDLVDAVRATIRSSRTAEKSKLGQNMRTLGGSLIREGSELMSSSWSSIKSSWTGSSDSATSSYDAVVRHSDTPNTNYGSAMDGLTGAGDTFNYYYNNTYGSGNTTQYSYGNSMNMRNRGCGPVALADAYTRRTGHGINAGALASAMNGSGNYDISRGTSVGGYLRTAGALGMGLTPGGVTVQSLRSASPNNPITVLGSGSGFGTRYGNNHYMNVIGTNGNGMAYVSNPMSGSITRVPTSTIAGNSVLGLYGRGDDDDEIAKKYHFSEPIAAAFSTLKSIAGALLSPFTNLLNGDDSEEENKYKTQVLKNQLGADKYTELEKIAKEKWQGLNPRRDGESDTEYEKRWVKVRNAFIATHSMEEIQQLLGDKYNSSAIGESMNAINADELSAELDRMYQEANEEAEYRRQVGDATISTASGGTALADGYTSNWVPRTTQPESGNKYYNTKGVGGYSTAIVGDPVVPGTNVLKNCSGYALGRFHEGVGRSQFDWMPRAWGTRDGGSWIETARGHLEVDTSGRGARPGDAISWKKTGGHGHVGVVEKVNGNKMLISHSGYGNFAFGTKELTQAADGTWPIGWNGYTFAGLVHNPGVTITPNNTGAIGVSTLGVDPSAAEIFSYLVNLGMSASGAAGMMGCMKHESGLRPNNLEDWYESKLGSDKEYTSRVNSGSESRQQFITGRGLKRFSGQTSGEAVGYGLTQFTTSNLKRDLYDHTVGRGRSIDDASGQLDVVASQLKSRKWDRIPLWDRIKNAKTPEEANQEFLWHYEAGTSYTSDKAVANAYPWMGMKGINARHQAARDYFNTLAQTSASMLVNTNVGNNTSAQEAHNAGIAANADGSIAKIISTSGIDGVKRYFAVNAAGENLAKLTYGSQTFPNTSAQQAYESSLRSGSKMAIVDGNRTYYVTDWYDSPAGLAASKLYATKRDINLQKLLNNLSGSGDISTDTSTIIPDISSRTMSDYLFDSLGTDTKTTVNNITLVRDDGSSKREEMDAALRGTYNVRSESIEAILEDILTELRSRRSSAPTPQAKPTSPENLFDNGNVPVQIQRLTTG